MNKKALILTLTPCLFLSAAIQAENAILTFEEMDRDSSGYITPAEARSSIDIAKKFKQVDSNGDGKLNITELQAFRGKDLMAPPEDMETPEPGAAPY